MPEKILFIKWGKFSLINDSIHGILLSEFEKAEIETFDAQVIWKQKTRIFQLLINIFFFISEYGMDFILGRKKLNEFVTWFLSTSFIALQTGKCIRQFVNGKKYRFSFQTQSLFNGKTKGIPHFIYIDHTTQTNLLYPDIKPKQYMRSDRFIKMVEEKIYMDADIVFTCGSLIAYSLINQYQVVPEKVVTVFAGSNAKDFFIENRDKYASKNILFVGVDWERKGGPVLINTFKEVLKKHKDASLTIVGCSPAKVTVPNCIIVGKISLDKLAAYYNKAAVFCLTTLREPFGIAFVEAMHYKLPIVSNNIGSLPDLVINDYNGYLINNNVQKYGNAICKLFDDADKCRILGENGFNFAKTKFTWELVGKKMKEQIVKFI